MNGQYPAETVADSSGVSTLRALLAFTRHKNIDRLTDTFSAGFRLECACAKKEALTRRWFCTELQYGLCREIVYCPPPSGAILLGEDNHDLLVPPGTSISCTGLPLICAAPYKRPQRKRRHLPPEYLNLKLSPLFRRPQVVPGAMVTRDSWRKLAHCPA